MINTEIYDIYHDESRQESYWHGFLFVPRSQRQYLLELLQKARIGAKWENHISFKDISTRTKNKSPRVQLVESWMSIALASLQQKKLLKLPVSFFICGKHREYHLGLKELIKCKFVIFKERDNHRKMFCGLSKMQKIEITLKMGAKGGIHKLFNDQEPIKIGNFVIDKFGYSSRLKSILQSFAYHVRQEKRNYVSFIKGAKIIPQDSDHNKIESSQNSDDSHFLQLCDIFLGGIRHHSYCPAVNSVKYKISLPCRLLLNHDINNYYRMKQSRFFNGFILNKCWLENGKWQFAPLELAENLLLRKFCQLKLPLKY